MAIDLADAVQAAVFARLEPAVTLAPVFAVVPDNTKPPVVVIGDSQGEQIGGKGSDAERHEISVRTIVQGTSKRVLFALMHEVKEGLHNQPLVYDGAALSDAVLLSSDDRRDIEDALLVGEQRFLVFAQSA